MTTINEFEAKKQAIYSEIIHLVNGDHDGDIEDQLELIKIQLLELNSIKPTCSTCKNFDEESGCMDWRNLIFVKNGIKDKESQFGCIHHSDYGDANE